MTGRRVPNPAPRRTSGPSSLAARELEGHGRTEAALRETQRRLDAVLNNASVAILLMDDRQQCVYMNAAAERLTGYTLSDMAGRPLHDVVHHTRPDGRRFPIEECAIDRAFPENSNVQGEEVFVHKDGRFYPVAFTASPIRDEASKTIGTIIEVRDISAEKAAEAELAERARTLEILNRTGAALAGELDLHRLVQSVTDAGVELTRAQFGAFFYNVLNERGGSYMLYTLSGVDRSHFDKFPMPRNTAVFHPTFAGQGILRSDDITADARYGKTGPHFGMPKDHLPVRSYLALPVMSRSGEVIGGLFFGHERAGVFTPDVERVMTSLAAQAAVAIDNARLFQAAEHELAERREAETALRASEQRFRAAVDAVQGVLWTNDSTGEMRGPQPGWASLTGQSYEAYQGFGWAEAVHADDVQPTVDAWRVAVAERRMFEFEHRVRRADGAWRRFSVRAIPIFATDGAIMEWVGVHTDVTELREREDQLRALNESLEVEVASRTRERDMVWRTSQELFAMIGPDQRYTAVNPAWTIALGWTHEELIGMHGGELVHPEDLEARAGDFEPLQRGEPARDIDLRIRTKAGDYRWFIWTAIPAADGVTYCEGRDVTQRKELEDQLRQAQKMEAVGQLTGGIAHDFNNLLTGIIGSLELLQKRIVQGRTNEIERYANAATTSANRAAALTHRLLAFSRRQPLDPKAVDANRLVSSMEDLLRRTIGEAIQFELVTAGGLWRTLCDPHQLEAAVLNLAINARDAMPEGGKLTIETCNAHLDTAYAARQREVKPGQYICICVSDTGTGMSPEVIARAFDPFFTTKPLGQGTGLGLSMIYGFARQSEGYVKIYSEVGQGTTVKLYLPRFRGEAAEDEADETAFGPQTRADQGEVVLVVEDEQSVRDLVMEVLRDLGYAAVEAIDGPTGLKLVQSLERVDLLITDVGLPGLNGRQLADAARAAKPGLPVLFMTGYAENAVVANGFLDPGMRMITKPFALDALAARIREIIEAEGAQS